MQQIIITRLIFIRDGASLNLIGANKINSIRNSKTLIVWGKVDVIVNVENTEWGVIFKN